MTLKSWTSHIYVQEKVDDGLERVFVNTAVKDRTTISEYMDCFLQKEIDNEKFPKLTNRMHYLKHEEGGVNELCEVMKKYSDEAYKQGEEAGKEILDFPHPAPYNKPIFFIKSKLQNMQT